MLWSLTPAGFLAGLAGVYCWRRRGAVIVLILGVIVGGCAAFAAVLFPDQTDPHPLAFAAVVGAVASVFWSFGSAVGIVTGFALWPSRPYKNSD